MINCFFVSDLHGSESRYHTLFQEIENIQPAIVFMGGDLFPNQYASEGDFLYDFLAPGFQKLKDKLKDQYPHVLLILGNDDPRIEEEKIKQIQHDKHLWDYIHHRKVTLFGYDIYGYSFIPPSPFALKDWEKYDVSRFVDPGCIAPTEGIRSVNPDYNPEFSNIKNDLHELTTSSNLTRSVFLFHTPPYDTPLDRAALDGKMIDFVPLDVHIGSIAVQRFIKERQPLLTLHGHVHEASDITDSWSVHLGKTLAVSAAWNKKELALVEFDLENPHKINRRLL